VTVLSERLGTLSLDSRGNERLEIWSTTPEIIAAHPVLGVGQGNYPIVSPEFGLVDVGGAPFDHAHDLFLNVASELGIVGLLLLLAMLLAVARSAKTVLAHRDSEFFPLGVALSASLLALLVNSITEYPLRENLILATLLIVIGLLAGMERLVRDSHSASPPSG
jgi:O-antigen ligase